MRRSASAAHIVLLATLTSLPSAAALADAAIAAAILPDSRSATVGSPVTIFATIVAVGGNAIGCSIAPATSIPATFVYQTTNPDNSLAGSPNTPANIANGGAQSFVLGFTPTAEFPPTAVPFVFDCTNSAPAPAGAVNTLTLSGSSTPTADVISIVSTLSNDGIVHFLPDGTYGVFAVAAINVGTGATIAVGVDPTPYSATLGIVGCQTDALGACINPAVPGALPVVLTLPANVPATFSVFTRSTSPIAFEPAANRIRVTFRDPGAVVRGSTSVAVEAETAIWDGFDWDEAKWL